MAEPHAPQPPLQDLTGTTVGRFAVRARLGVGGMGEVYRADDTTLKRSVALKRVAPQLRSDERYRQRLLKEAERASALDSEHVAGVYDVLDDKGELFLVLEYVEGQTLRQRLERPLPLEAFLELAAQSAEALVAAHQRGVIHRDLKPENIMLTPAGRVKVLDFGVAKRLPRPDQTAPTETLEPSSAGGLSGTPAYMAPETLLEQEVDGRADIFSLGVVFYEALTGRHPFLAGSFVATSDRILRETPPPLTRLNPRVPAELERMVAKMLAKRPEDRYATAADLLVDLRALKAGVRPPPRRKPWLRWAAGGAVAAALAAGTLVPSVRQEVLCAVGLCPVPAQKNLAVVPFTNVGGEAANQAFCDGLAFSLTSKLSQLEQFHGSLLVVPASEVVNAGVRTAEEARKEFGVNLVLTGSVQRTGEAVRLTASLVDARSRRQLRSLTLDARAEDSSLLQDGVALRVAELLEVELQPQARSALAAGGTAAPGAFDYYVQGLGYLQRFEKQENIESAIGLFRRALELDPRFALAQAALGQAYWRQYDASQDAQWVEASRKACQQALKLDAQLAEAHVCLGTVHQGTGQYEAAAQDFLRALELEPTSAQASRGLAGAYERRGKLAEAEETYRQAIRMRPNDWASHEDLGVFYYRYGRYAEAEAPFRHVLELTPDNVRGYYNLGALYHLMGRTDEGIEMFRKSLAIEPTGAAYSNLGTLLFFEGRYPAAVPMFEKAVELTPNNYVMQGNLADGYRWAPGERHKAAPVYRRALELAEKQLAVNPHDAEVLGDMALYQAKLGETGKALASVAAARREAPEDVNLLFEAAVVFQLAGQTERAADALEKAVRDGYSLAEIRAEPELAELRRHRRIQALLGD